MQNAKQCPKCSSTNIFIVPGSVGKHGSGNNIPTNFTIFGSVKVTRYVCVECGFTEEWIDDKEDIRKLMKKYGS